MSENHSKEMIRRARPEDARSIAEVHVQSWRETYPDIIPKNILDALSIDERTKAWGKNLLEGPPHFPFTYVATDSHEKIVGFASGGAVRKDLMTGLEELTENFDGEMSSLYLLKEHQRLGLGRKLFNSVSDELKKREYKKMLVRVLKDNPAKGFYAHMGGISVAEDKIQMIIWLEEIFYSWNLDN